MRRVRVLNRSKSFGRELRVAEFIRKELSDLIRKKMRDPRIATEFVSVNDVRVSRDFSFADVYVSSLDINEPHERDIFMKLFESAAGFLRSELAQRARMRTTPRLRFHYDDLQEQGQQMDMLIDEAIRIEDSHNPPHRE